jgi:hypothetical protein
VGGSLPVNCAHLHSAFGPGCPYCTQGVATAAPDGHPGGSVQAAVAGPADWSTAYRPGDRPKPGKIMHADPGLDLGAVA